MNLKYKLFCGIITSYLIFTCQTCDSFKLNLIVRSSRPEIKRVIADAKKYEVQIRYTQIDRDKNDIPTFHTYEYNVNPNHYFYPASTVKMPVAFLALQYLNELKNASHEVTKDTPLSFHKNRNAQSEMLYDSLCNSLPTIGSFIEEIFVISDNNAYNRLYELLGQKYINENLQKIGVFSNSHIIHRVGISGFAFDENKFVNAVTIHTLPQKVVIPQRKDSIIFKKNLKGLQKGIGYIDNYEQLIHKPFDFSTKNYFSIKDLEACLMRILFPETFEEEDRFNLTSDDYGFLYKTMLKLPKDIPYLAADSAYFDGYVKFFYNGNNRNPLPSNIKIMNKVGDAYGTLTDCSYIFDTITGAEFLLTSTINVNTDGIYNDGKYDYETIGFPFMDALGKEILKFEQSRSRKYKSRFQKYLGTTEKVK